MVIKYTSIIVLIYFSISTVSSKESFLQSLQNIIDNLLTKVQEEKEALTESISKNDESNSTILHKLANRGFSNFHQELKTQKFVGIQPAKFGPLLNLFTKRLVMPDKYIDEFRAQINQIVTCQDSEWKVYKYIYRNNRNNGLDYVCIFVQKNKEQNKINLVYTQINTDIVVADIFVAKNTITYSDGSIKDSVSIVQQPKEVTNEDLDKVIKFFDIVGMEAIHSNFSGLSFLG